MHEASPPHPDEAAGRPPAALLLDALSARIAELEEIGAQVREAYGPLLPSFVARALREHERAIFSAREAASQLEQVLADRAG
jgi:hypothetical protein